MSGHSKWSTIKRKKAANDAKRGKIMTKLLREVQVAARMGGPSPDANPRLKAAIQTAKSMSVPNDNIERAIKRGAGDDGAENYEEVVYEGYGPAGVALLIRVLTDNRNRSVAEVRHALTKVGGSLGSSNSVAYLFEDRGIVTVLKGEVNEEELLEAVLEAGASDVVDRDDCWEVVAGPSEFRAVCQSVEDLGKEFEANFGPVATTLVRVEGEEARSVLRLVDALEDLDDVQAVMANFDIDDSDMQELEA